VIVPKKIIIIIEKNETNKLSIFERPNDNLARVFEVSKVTLKSSIGWGAQKYIEKRLVIYYQRWHILSNFQLKGMFLHPSCTSLFECNN
jgi:hypothetical protein